MDAKRLIDEALNEGTLVEYYETTAMAQRVADPAGMTDRWDDVVRNLGHRFVGDKRRANREFEKLADRYISDVADLLTKNI